jgi:GNAT superfamily N-acetyltransferase
MTDNSQQLELAGHIVTIRPMCHADAEMEREFVRCLSPESKHYRFLGAVRELSPQELRRFCNVDGHRSMAFVATIEEGGRPMQIGVSRYAPNADGNAREIAITVADDWQHLGLGTRLAKALIQPAREHGVKKLYSIDLADNTHMQCSRRIRA